MFKTFGELIVIDFKFDNHIDIYNYCYHLGLDMSESTVTTGLPGPAKQSYCGKKLQK